MAKRISSGETKTRRAPARRPAEKRAAAPAASPAGAVGRTATPGEVNAERPEAAAKAPREGARRREVPVAGSGGDGSLVVAERPLAESVALAASERAGVWGREETAADRDAIARRAFELFLQRGGTHGHDVDDWLTAERELQHRRRA